MNNVPKFKHLVIYGFVLSLIHFAPEEQESLFHSLPVGLWSRSLMSGKWIQSPGRRPFQRDDSQWLLSFSRAAGICGSGGKAGQMQQELLIFLPKKMSETITHVWVMPSNWDHMFELPTSHQKDEALSLTSWPTEKENKKNKGYIAKQIIPF